MVKTWIGSIIAAVVGLFHKAEVVADDIFKAADTAVSTIKTLEQSQIVQFLETGLEAVFPQFTGIIEGIRAFIPKAAGLIANVDASVTTDEGKIQAFLDYAQKATAGDITVGSGAYNTLNAAIQQYLATASNVGGLTPQMSLAGAQVAHDPTLGTGQVIEPVTDMVDADMSIVNETIANNNSESSPVDQQANAPAAPAAPPVPPAAAETAPTMANLSYEEMLKQQEERK